MIPGITKKDIPFLLLSFFIPLILLLITRSHSLMFDDAGEFALVIKLGSIAHPPGTPAYILKGMAWTELTGLFGLNVIDSLTLFSAICVSITSLLLYYTFKIITVNSAIPENNRMLFVCSLSALAFATSSTTWAWGNTIEVYSFQLATLAVTITGITLYHFGRKKIPLALAAIGIAAGLGGHHLTMLLFLPFVPVFFLKNIFVSSELSNSKKKSKLKEERFISQYLKVLSERDFWLLAGIILFFTMFFYGWMFWRAQQNYPFMFGKPETISELLYHVSGGSYSKNISSTSDQIISSRIPYFLQLTAMQLFVFIPFFVFGIIILLRKKLFRIFWIIILYFLSLFIYQINNNQWSSTDAYMLLPFMMLSIIVFYGIIFYSDKIKAQWIVPVLLCIQIVYNFPLHDRRSYPVSDSLMDLLDKSAPKNSVILVSDWSTVIQYYYYRIVENFRPDLVVLNYDFKFTHYKILPTLYPDFYKMIKPEYDAFVNELSKEHPHQVVNTGCDLNTPALSSSFRTLVHKTEEVAKAQKVSLLTDPRAHYFYGTEKFYDSRRYVSGCFSSSLPGDSTANANFIKLDLPFLKSPLLLKDPAALDKLVDFQAMLDRHIDFYKVNNYTQQLSEATKAHDRIIGLQRKMKKSMSFAYKIR